MADNVSYTSYGRAEKELIKSGIAAIREVLTGSDSAKKKSLLLALDWFMDPYYKQDIYISDFRHDLVELLQTVIISDHDEEVLEDALHLLGDYEWPPFEILEKNMDKVPERLKKYALEIVNMDK